MQTRRFDKQKDTKIVAKWLRKRGLPIYSLPHLGFIAFCDNGEAVAAGFLRSCEDKHAILDSFITNPDESPEIRDVAMDALTKRVIEAAEDLELDGLVAYTIDKNTLMRSLKYGFQVQPHTVITMKLKENK